jgi:hypothetical protein
VIPAANARLTGHRAAPSTARCHTRSFAHANYLLRIYAIMAGGFDPRGAPVDNDVETL